jgi:hypothetical protein
MKTLMAVVLGVSCISALFLTGCTIVTPVPGPDNQKAYLIECGTLVLNVCYEKADRMCPNGYTVISSQPTYNANSITVQCK